MKKTVTRICAAMLVSTMLTVPAFAELKEDEEVAIVIDANGNEVREATDIDADDNEDKKTATDIDADDKEDKKTATDIDADEEDADDDATDLDDDSESKWDGPVLNSFNGTVMGPSGKETYYNLDMSGVIHIMRGMGNTDEYWVREDGCKMLGDYIMCAANLSVHPRGSLVESSLGTCIVCDTGGFAAYNPNQLDIAVTW